MAEHETDEELDAAIAVYGSNCTIIRRSPPHLVVRLQPRTADDISSQYVEAVLVIKASDEYPQKPPMLELKDTKGLDEVKVAQLALELENLANKLIFNPMLVYICEAALDRLTEMNQPDGNCCFCMDPLVMENGKSELRPFIKLLSCFHCFHSDCFGRWWRWVLEKRCVDYSIVFHGLGPKEDPESMDLIASCKNLLEEIEMKCPVCRKFISAQDLAFLWSILAADRIPNQDRKEMVTEEHEFMFSESEVVRKVRFHEIFKAQQSCGGIIEPKKLEVLVPGMFVSVPSTRGPLCPEPRDGAAASSVVQASDSSSSLAVAGGEAEPLVQDMDNLRLGAEEQAVHAHTREATESTRKFIAQVDDNRRRKGGRHQNYAGGKKGQWVRRDQGGGK